MTNEESSKRLSDIELLLEYHNNASLQGYCIRRMGELVLAYGPRSEMLQGVMEHKECYTPICYPELKAIIFASISNNEVYNSIKVELGLQNIWGSLVECTSSVESAIKKFINDTKYKGEYSMTSETCKKRAMVDIDFSKYQPEVDLEELLKEAIIDKANSENEVEVEEIEPDIIEESDISDFELPDPIELEGEPVEELEEPVEEIEEPVEEIEELAEQVEEQAEEPPEPMDIEIDDTEYPEDLEEIVSAVVNRNESVFRNCLEMDIPHSILYSHGAMTFKKEKGRIVYVAGRNQGTSVFEKVYNAIQNGTGVTLADSTEMSDLPIAENIKNLNYEYYPAYMLGYALGYVDNKKYTNWSSFSNALEGSVREFLKRFYREEGANVFYQNIGAIEKVYSTAILVLNYQAGSGMKIRVSLPGIVIDANKLQASLNSIQTYRNASIVVTPVNGNTDVVDVQIAQDLKKFLGQPFWAYQAMKVRIENGEPVSLVDGLPMGKLSNGNIVEFRLDQSDGFMTFIAAGSGSGKGVLTLSLLAAAIGSGLPVYYIDYKPDMASIFWDIEKKYKINTFAYDGVLTENDRFDVLNSKSIEGVGNPRVAGFGMPKEVVKQLSQYAPCLVYMKAMQLVLSRANYRMKHKEDNKPVMFVCDEIQKLQSKAVALYNAATELNKAHKPVAAKKGEQPVEDTVYRYTKRVIEFIEDLNNEMGMYLNTTGRVSGVFSIFIAQSAVISDWTITNKVDFMAQTLKAGTVCKIIGKGGTTAEYGLNGSEMSKEEKDYIEENRFFGMVKSKKAKSLKPVVFKPFLTLNDDDPFSECWGKGMGAKYGYGKSGVTNNMYISNLMKDHRGEEPYVNKYGLHTGTGFLGLATMYCGGDMNKLVNNFGLGWEDCQWYLQAIGLNGKYSTPTEFVCDASEDSFYTVYDLVNGVDRNSNNNSGDGSEHRKEFVPKFEESSDEDEPDAKSSGEDESGVLRDSAQELPIIDASELFGESYTGRNDDDSDSAFTINNDNYKDSDSDSVNKSAFSINKSESESPFTINKSDSESESAFSVNESPFTINNRDNDSQPINLDKSAYEKEENRNVGFSGEQNQSQGPENMEPSDNEDANVDELAQQVYLDIIGSKPDSWMDLLDFVAYELDNRYRNKEISLSVAKGVAIGAGLVDQGYYKDYSFKSPYKPRERVDVRKATTVENTQQRVTWWDTKNKSDFNVDTRNTNNFTYANDGNSINIERGEARGTKMFRNLLFETPFGSSLYVEQLWKSVLNSIADAGYRSAMITRVSFHSGQMYVNGKIVNMNGILGGLEDVRLVDIVNFKILMKKYNMIREMKLDEEMLSVLNAELGRDAIKQLFDMGKKLLKIEILRHNGTVMRCTKEQHEDEKYRQLEKEKELENQLKMAAMAKSRNKTTTDEVVFGRKFADKCISSAGKEFKKKSKKSYGKGVIAGAVGLTIGVTGTLLYRGWQSIKDIIGMGKSLRS